MGTDITQPNGSHKGGRNHEGGTHRRGEDDGVSERVSSRASSAAPVRSGKLAAMAVAAPRVSRAASAAADGTPMGVVEAITLR